MEKEYIDICITQPLCVQQKSTQHCKSIHLNKINLKQELVRHDGYDVGMGYTFDPDQILSPFIINLTHITQEMVDASDPINIHIRNFLSFLDTSIIVAHNAQFDLNFLNEHIKDIL